MNRKLKIGITCYPTAGGSGVVATELGLALAERGHEVHFISYAAPLRLRAFQENVFYHPVEVSAYPLFKFPPYDIALASRMAEVISSVGLDVLHVHYAIPHAVSAYLANHTIPDSRTRVITTLHGTDITLVGAERSYFGITKFAIENSQGVTAVSRYLRDETVRIFDIKRPIEVVHNFVDTDIFHARPCAKVRARFAEPDEKILMHISNMRPVKRVPDVVRVFAETAKHVPARLLMIGEGPERAAAEDLCRELGVCDKTSFLGSQEGIPELLCAADLFLLPSEYETFGLSALEAMACETPVILTNKGGTTELVRHGEDGFLHAPGDIAGMAATAVDLLKDDAKRRRIGEQARARAVTEFSKQRLVDAYEAYYCRIRDEQCENEM